MDVSTSKGRMIRFGGIALLFGSFLMLGRVCFFLGIPAPPGNDGSIVNWAANAHFGLAMSNELLFFAVFAMLPASIALFLLFYEQNLAKAVFGCGIILISVPIVSLLNIIHGRLVYPVFGVLLSEESARYTISVFSGGMHAINLMYAVALVTLGLAMRNQQWGSRYLILSSIVAVSEIAGAYPWVLGHLGDGITQTMYVVWLASIGIKVVTLRYTT
jgi:hypothetical protein